MSDEQEVDVLIDPEEEVQQFKASPVALSKEGEQRFLSLQEHYRVADHREWNKRENLKYEKHNEHIQTTNRFNLINSVVSFSAFVAIIAILVKVIQ